MPVGDAIKQDMPRWAAQEFLDDTITIEWDQHKTEYKVI